MPVPVSEDGMARFGEDTTRVVGPTGAEASWTEVGDEQGVPSPVVVQVYGDVNISG